MYVFYAHNFGATVHVDGINLLRNLDINVVRTYVH